MTREELEHVVGAAANVLNEDAFVIIGSQAILGPHPDAPPELLRSMEADIYPRDVPERAIEIDGSLGDGSQFHAAYGFYAHGVGPETAKAPAGWQQRLIRIDISPRVASRRQPVAFCLEPHDLVLAKCVRGDVRDWEFARDCLRSGLVRLETLLERVPFLPISENDQQTIARALGAAIPS